MHGRVVYKVSLSLLIFLIPLLSHSNKTNKQTNKNDNDYTFVCAGNHDVLLIKEWCGFAAYTVNLFNVMV